MKIARYVLLMIFCLLCIGCSQTVPDKNDPSGFEGTTGTPGEATDINSSDVPYEEALDSLDGVDVTDLSLLKEALDSVGSNYTSKTHVYFNKLAVNRVNIILKTTFYCNQVTYYNENYIYRYSKDFVINKGYINLNNNIYNVSLTGTTLNDKLNSVINLDKKELLVENSSVTSNYFTLKELNSAYVDTYGPTTVVYTDTYSVDYAGWTRIGVNKFKCDRTEVIEDFIKLCVPGYGKDGAYMTYRYVTVEVNPDNVHMLRLRLYASPTQVGKLIDSHIDKEKPNWYLLFAEAYISDVNNVKISAFEKIYN